MKAALAAFALVAGLSAAVDAAGPETFIEAGGLYGLVPHDAAPGSAMVQDFLRHPHFAGVSVRTGWDNVEAVEDAYDWSYIDAMIAAAGAHGKRIVLRVRPSWETPEWVFDASAEAFWYYERNDSGRLHRMPIPWDPVFQAKWIDFVAALGHRYAGNPGLAHVLITGASRSDCEMYLPANRERALNQPTWEDAGYTPARMIDAWTRVVDAWAAALPATLVSLSVSSVLYGDGVMEAVVDHCTIRHPWRVALKISYWGHDNDPSYAPTRAFLAAVDERTHGGVEAVSILADMPDAARDAIAWHAVLWAEPYPSNRDQLQALHDEQQRHRQRVRSTRLTATPQNRRVALSWTSPSGDEGFRRVRLLRKTEGSPAGPDDPAAVVIYEGSGTSAVDNGLERGTPCHYALYELPSRYTIAVASTAPR